MAKYKIHLKLNTLPLNGDHYSISISNDTFIFNLSDTPGVGQVEIGSDILSTAGNMRQYFELVLNAQGKYLSQVYNSDTLEIIADSDTIPTFAITGDVTGSYTVETESIVINSTTISNASSDTCGKVDINVTTNITAVKLLSPYINNSLNSSAFTLVDQLRGQSINIEVEDINGNRYYKVVTTPPVFNTSQVSFTINMNNIYISNNTSGLILQYSIDNVNWQYENAFSNLTAGNYTLHAKDIYGCTGLYFFTITQSSGVEPIYDDYFNYPKANPIRMALRQEWNNYGIMKNSFNTLSCEEAFDDIVYTDKHLYLVGDTPVIQLKNNYDDLSVKLNDGTVLAANKISNNMNLKDSLDAKVKVISDGKIAIYFTSGNKYDYDSGAVIDIHSLNGELPEFAKVGVFITVNNYNYKIESLAFNDSINSNVIIISSSITDTDVIVKAIYNLLDYEVYNIYIPMVAKTIFNIQISFNGKLQLVSELIKVVDHSDILVKIEYLMSYNTDIFFNAGFKGISRFLIDTIKDGIDNENEKYNTDTEFFQIDSKNFEVDVFKFLPLTKEVARQLVLILSHDTININGIEYVKDTIEKELLDRSNLYVVTATMKIKHGDMDYNNNNVPGTIVQLVDSGKGFIKY